MLTGLDPRISLRSIETFGLPRIVIQTEIKASPNSTIRDAMVKFSKEYFVSFGMKPQNGKKYISLKMNILLVI